MQVCLNAWLQLHDCSSYSPHHLPPAGKGLSELPAPRLVWKRSAGKMTGVKANSLFVIASAVATPLASGFVLTFSYVTQQPEPPGNT